jgi:hypothetical protein
VRGAGADVVALLQWMLAYVPADRPTAAAALQHPAFRGAGPRPAPAPQPLVARRHPQAKGAGIVVPGRAGVVAGKAARRGIGSPPRGIGGQQTGRAIGALKLKLPIGPQPAVKIRF